MTRPEHAVAGRDVQEMSCAADVASLAHALLAAQQGDADLAFLQRERQAECAALELDELLAAHISQPGHDGDAVPDTHDAAGVEEFLDARLRVRVAEKQPTEVLVGVVGIAGTSPLSNPSRTARSIA